MLLFADRTAGPGFCRRQLSASSQTLSLGPTAFTLAGSEELFEGCGLCSAQACFTADSRNQTFGRRAGLRPPRARQNHQGRKKHGFDDSTVHFNSFFLNDWIV
jgi:hypothetical protein